MKKKLTTQILALATAFFMGMTLVLLIQVKQNELPIVHASGVKSEAFDQMQNKFRSVAAENLPVVVEINVLNTKEAGQEMSESVPWDDYFSAPDSDVPRDRFNFYGLGSGVIIKKTDSLYYVVTNYHVVGNSDQIEVTLYDGSVFSAQPVGVDSRKDLALISFESDADFPVASLGKSSDLYVGDWVLAIGNPLGYESSVTAGIISALGRENGPDDNISDFIQTDASINQGNSGGALINMKGELIGINTWISTNTGGSMGLGFSLPVDNVISSVDDLIAYGKPLYGWLGVSMGDVSSQIAQEFNLASGQKGAFIYQVFIDSPAWKGGVRAGDFIFSLNGIEVENRSRLTYLIGELDPESTITLGVMRNGKKRDIPVTLDYRADEDSVGSLNTLAWPGVVVLPLNEVVRDALGLSDTFFGVIIEDSYAKTPFQLAGMQVGDIIEEINGEKIETLGDFYGVIGDSSSRIYTLKVKRITDKVNELEIIVKREVIDE